MGPTLESSEESWQPRSSLAEGTPVGKRAHPWVTRTGITDHLFFLHPRALRNPCGLHSSLLEASNPAQATSPKMGGLSPSSQGSQELLPNL